MIERYEIFKKQKHKLELYRTAIQKIVQVFLLHLHFRAYMVTTIDEDDVAQWSIVFGHVSSQVQVFSTFVKAFN